MTRVFPRRSSNNVWRHCIRWGGSSMVCCRVSKSQPRTIGIPLQQFLQRGDMLAGGGIGAIQRTKDSIICVQQVPKVLESGLPVALHSHDEIVNVNVSVLDWLVKRMQDWWWWGSSMPLVGAHCKPTGLIQCRALSPSQWCLCGRIWGRIPLSGGCQRQQILWRRCVGSFLQRMRGWHHMGGPVGCNIGDRFSGSAKPGGRFDPAHGQHEREGN